MALKVRKSERLGPLLRVPMVGDDNRGMTSTLTDSDRLNHLCVVSAQGRDAAEFLQGQLTQDVKGLDADRVRFGGYCSPKGRLLANFLLLRPAPETIWMVCPTDVAPALIKRLRMFVLRAQCQLQLEDRLGIWGSHSPSTLPPLSVAPAETESAQQPGETSVTWHDGRQLIIAPLAPSVASPLADPTPSPASQQWMWSDVNAGIPWITSATADQFVPQMVNMELIGGVNFQKGCYPGQEVVARSQYRGTLKRRMALFEAKVSLHSGQEVFHSEDPEQPAGMVVNAASQGPNTRALVEIKLAALEQGSLHLGSSEGPLLHQLPLPYSLSVDVTA